VTERRTVLLRPWLAAVLILVLTLAGGGQGRALTSDASDTVVAVPGLTMPICHSDGGRDGPAVPDHHDCCDACALCAPVVLPGPATLQAPTRVIHVITHAAALGWAPVLARPRTPRLAQGPPTA
jgi:NAD-dependent dihydropyrimidine dehydrogenase PreA subunit